MRSGSLAWARLFLIRSTSGFTLTAGLVSFVVAMFVGLTANTGSFLPGLADPLNLTLTACLYLGPVGAGAAAAQMATFHRLGLAQLASSTPRGLAAAKWLEIGPIAAWQLVAYTALGVLVLSRSDLDGPASAAMLLLPLQAVVLLVASVAVGAAVADAYRPRLVAPAVAGVVFVVLYVLVLQGGPSSRFSPVYSDIFYRVPLQPRVHLLLAMTSLLVAIGGLAASRTLVGRGGRRVVAAVSVGGLVAAATVLGLSSDERTEVRAQSDDPPCRSQDGVTLCVWPESSDSLAPGLGALTRVTRIARPFLDTPTFYHETGLRPQSPDDTEFAVPLLPERREIVFAVLAALPAPCETASSMQAHGELIGWLLAEVGAQDGGRAGPETAAVLDLAPPAKRAWVRERVERLSPACDA